MGKILDETLGIFRDIKSNPAVKGELPGIDELEKKLDELYPKKSSALEEFAATTLKETPSASKMSTTPMPTRVPLRGSGRVITRPNLDPETMRWQLENTRAELWLLEGHLKNHCKGCGADVSCCFKTGQNIIDLVRETKSMTTDPIWDDIIKLGEEVRTKAHPDHIKAGTYFHEFPQLIIRTSELRKKIETQLIEHFKPGLTLAQTSNPGPVLSPTAKKIIPHVLIDEEENKRIHELRAQGLSTPQIGKQLGRHRTTINRILKRGYAPLHRAITPPRIEEALQLRLRGLTLEEIGEHTGGVSSMQAHRILARGKESIDMAGEIKKLNNSLLRVSDGLKRPDTLNQLTAAAIQLRDIGDNTELLFEIMPKAAPEELDLDFVRSRAWEAEGALHNGIWCLEEKPRWEKFAEMQRKERGRLFWEEGLAEADRLAKCANKARDIARGVIENWAGYHDEAAIQEQETEERMMTEERMLYKIPIIRVR